MKLCPNGHITGEDLTYCPICGAMTVSFTKVSRPEESGLRCPYCNRSVPADSVFCPECGKMIQEEVCRNCGKPWYEGGKYCRYCGASMDEEGSRITDIAPIYGPPPIPDEMSSPIPQPGRKKTWWKRRRRSEDSDQEKDFFSVDPF